MADTCWDWLSWAVGAYAYGVLCAGPCWCIGVPCPGAQDERDVMCDWIIENVPDSSLRADRDGRYVAWEASGPKTSPGERAALEVLNAAARSERARRRHNVVGGCFDFTPAALARARELAGIPSPCHCPAHGGRAVAYCLDRPPDSGV